LAVRGALQHQAQTPHLSGQPCHLGLVVMSEVVRCQTRSHCDGTFP
jgi:hypothetical protein